MHLEHPRSPQAVAPTNIRSRKLPAAVHDALLTLRACPSVAQAMQCDAFMACRVYRALCFACHLQESSPSKLFLTHKALNHAKGLLKRGLPKGFLSLAKGTRKQLARKHVCEQRVRGKDTYHASDFFFAAAVSLVLRGVLDGAGLARHYKKSASMIGDWYEHAAQLAAQVGLCGEGGASKSSMQKLCGQLQPTKGSLMAAGGIDVPLNVPSVVENPTGEQLENTTEISATPKRACGSLPF